MELVTRGLVQIINVPAEPIDLDFKTCCYENKVLATTSADPSNFQEATKHECFAVFYQREFANTTIVYELVPVGGAPIPIVDDTYGRYINFTDFSDNEDLSFLELDWNKVLEEEGEGVYYVNQIITINGTPYPRRTFNFKLRRYTNKLADKTFRWDVQYDGFYVHLGIDFTGTDLKSSLRLPGFFGNPNPELEQELFVDTSDVAETFNFRQDFEYVAQTNMIPGCIIKEIFEHFHYAPLKWMSDFNTVNIDWNIRRFPVILDNIEKPETISVTYSVCPPFISNRIISPYIFFALYSCSLARMNNLILLFCFGCIRTFPSCTAEMDV
jgi:hypothetical protein